MLLSGIVASGGSVHSRMTIESVTRLVVRAAMESAVGEGGREGGREGERERGRERGREGGKEEDTMIYIMSTAPRGTYTTCAYCRTYTFPIIHVLPVYIRVHV